VRVSLTPSDTPAPVKVAKTRKRAVKATSAPKAISV